MIPGYTEKLAEKLGIVKERVAIRGKEVMQAIEFEMDKPRKDSMMVTPIGICLSYYEQSNNFIFVEFNNERIKLYDNGKLSVTDAAMQLQFPNEDLFPKRGEALVFEVNGKSRMVRGMQGEAAVIMVNGDPGDMYTQVHSGDRITVVPSTMGEAATMELGKLPELGEQLHIYVNGKKLDMPKTAEVNGKRENEYYQIQTGDVIRVFNSYTVQEIAEFLDMPLGGDIRVNDTSAQPDTKVYENFTVSWNPEISLSYVASAKEEDYEEEMQVEPVAVRAINQVDVNPVAVQETVQATSDTKDEEAAEEILQPKISIPRPMSVLVNRMPITMNGKAEYVFVDVFDYIDFDLKASAGRSIVTNLNGRTAGYMENLKDGDVIEIYWKPL